MKIRPASKSSCLTFSFIADRRDDLVGIVVTHGHEDHLGAIEYLWSNLQCPVYVTPFTAAMLRSKLNQSPLRSQVRILELPMEDSTFEIGPFKDPKWCPSRTRCPIRACSRFKRRMEPLIHTGDWKFDPDPVLGVLSDEARLKALGDAGVLAVVGDSTGAMVTGHSQSERSVEDGFRSVFASCKKRIVVTCFSSNIARMKTVAKVAREQGRYVGLVGRSLWRNAETAELLRLFARNLMIFSRNMKPCRLLPIKSC